MQLQQDHQYRLSLSWNHMLKDLGVDPEALAQEARLPINFFRCANSKLSASQYFLLWRTLEKHYTNPNLALMVGIAPCQRVFNVAAFTLLCSKNFIEALKYLQRFGALISPIQFSIEETEDSVTVKFKKYCAVETAPSGMVMADVIFILDLLRQGLKRNVVPECVMTAFPFNISNEYKRLFEIDITPGTENLLRFSKADATQQFVAYSEQVQKVMIPMLEDKLRCLTKSHRYAGQVKAIVMETLSNGGCHLNNVAEQLAMSPRTLQRRLKAEGVSFRSLLTESRSESAMAYLRDTNLTCYQISHALGFEDQNSFFRAFHSWAGITPDKARHAIRGIGSPVAKAV